jgi:hypothetical protein
LSGRLLPVSVLQPLAPLRHSHPLVSLSPSDRQPERPRFSKGPSLRPECSPLLAIYIRHPAAQNCRAWSPSAATVPVEDSTTAPYPASRGDIAFAELAAIGAPRPNPPLRSQLPQLPPCFAWPARLAALPGLESLPALQFDLRTNLCSARPSAAGSTPEPSPLRPEWPQVLGVASVARVRQLRCLAPPLVPAPASSWLTAPAKLPIQSKLLFLCLSAQLLLPVHPAPMPPSVPVR